MTRLPLLLLLPLLQAPAAAAQAVFEHWGQEAGNARRSNAIRYTGGSPKSGAGYVLVKDLGEHKLDVAGVWPTLPVFAPSGHVVVADVDNFLLVCDPPERVPAPDPTQGAPDAVFSWPTTTTYARSGAFVFGAPPLPSSSAAVDDQGRAFWVNRRRNELFAADLSGLATGSLAIPDLFAPVNLSAVGFKTYIAEFALLLHADRVWLPDPSEHSALVVDADSGARSLAKGILPAPHRLLGSVGAFGPRFNAEGAAFTDMGAQPAGRGGIYGIESTAPFNTATNSWKASVPFVGIANDMQHPVSLSFSRGGASWACVVASNAQAFDAKTGRRGGLRITGVRDDDGTTCGSGNPFNAWGTNDGDIPGTYLVVNDFTANASWVSAPAVVPDGEGYRLYYTINLVKPVRCVLYSVLVSITGLYEGSTEGVRLGTTTCNAAPVALLDAWGKGFHAIAAMQSNGVVSVYDWKAFSPLQVHFSLHPFLPQEDGAAVIFAGSYLALSPAGTLLAIAHVAKSQRAFLVAIVGGFTAPPQPPGGPPAPPSPGPTPGNNVVTDAGRPIDNVVAGLFGGVSLLAALVALFVASYPEAAASRLILAGARSAWGAGAGAASRLTDAVLRGGKPPTQLSFGVALAPAPAAAGGGSGGGGGGGERASLLRPAGGAAAPVAS